MEDALDVTHEGLKVFISYSRQDEDFVRELITGLELTGFKPFVDQHDIAAGEEWELRLGRLIEGADTVVFVISPSSIKSSRCSWEVDRTVSLNKKLLPIVWQPVEEAQVPVHLKRLNYIFFNKLHSFAPSLATLAGALKTDVEWLRRHTQIGENALRWQSNGRAEAFLMRGVEVTSTLDWLKSQPRYAPEPSLLMRQFIQACQDGETARANSERQRLEEIAAAQIEREKALREKEELIRNRARVRVAAFSAVSLVAAVAGWEAWRAATLREQDQAHLKQALEAEANATAARNRAEQARIEAEDLKVLADENRALAEKQRITAEAEAKKAQEALSLAMKSVKTVTVFRQRITAPNADREAILAELARDSTAMITSLQEMGGGREMDATSVELMVDLSSNPTETFANTLGLAERGNVSAMAEVGTAYYKGIGVKRDLAQALAWWQKAGNAGDAASQNSVGAMYFNGQGVARDYVHARDWFEKAAAANNEAAMRFLGYMYSQGAGVAKNLGTARTWYEKAAELGSAEAMNSLGSSYSEGEGSDQDFAKARDWYEKAVKAGSTIAMVNLGWLYINGEGVPRDYAVAREWMEKAAEKGDERSYGPLAALYTEAKDYAKALPLLEKSAASGNGASMNGLGVAYAHGQGVPQDYKQAFSWFEKAAAAGVKVAQRNLGRVYEDGLGTARDYAKAMEWYQKAAAADDSPAMVYIGLFYENGQGVTADYAQAMTWYQKAAKLGNPAGLNNVGSLYNNGLGVPQDYAKALEWYLKGAAAGSATSLRNLGWLYGHGQGAEKDLAKARDYYERAGEAGDTTALRYLGWMYADGEGVAPDFAKARQLFERGAAAGDSLSKQALLKLPIEEATAAGNYTEVVRLREAFIESVEKDEIAADGKPGADTVSALGNLSYEALLAGNPEKSLSAADRALALMPKESWIEMNRAHALMFLNRTEDARRIYLAHKGEATGRSKRQWQKIVEEDFDAFRKVGLTNPLMAEIEKNFQE